MIKNLKGVWCVICQVLLCIVVLVKGFNDNERKTYIVYMGALQEENGVKLSVIDEHHKILSEIVGDEMLARELRIHSYGRSFNGFVANLLPHEASKLKEKENVISVFPNKVHKLLTTKSWDYLGMPLTVKRKTGVENNMIVAIFDTGIWMPPKSFDDKGYGPPPAKWKGKCDKGPNFTKCNNKVIGAQFFNLNKLAPPDQETPADPAGHGTHCASVVAGNAVPGTSLYGIAEGTVRGGVPSARISSYRVCWIGGCPDVDLLAAFDAAISDGVDVISISLATTSASYLEDVIAIGAFHALQKGIFTSCAAGNDGPAFYTVKNVVPWVITVGAGATDINLQTRVKLGNGKVYNGISINTFEPKNHMIRLTSGTLAGNGNKTGNSSLCDDGTLSEDKVKGAIVYCQGRNAYGGQSIGDMQGAGSILSSDLLSDSAFDQAIPSSIVRVSEGKAIDQYINSTKYASAIIYKTTTAKQVAPYVISFSSRGPQSISLNILKPDICGPGGSILAAWTELTPLIGGKRVVKYNIESGSSMACPHVAGAAAYVKSFHPEWSAAAIKSALMTTSTLMKIIPKGGALSSGSGMMSPTKALDPGLVYDIDSDSYISFLCKEGYNSTVLALITGDKNFDCSKVKPAQGTDGLNYPSMLLALPETSTDISAVYYRTLTNVGEVESVYTARITSDKELSISVDPNKLSFTKSDRSLSFKVAVNGKFSSEKSWVLSGSLVWSSFKHTVRSPILVYRNMTKV